MYPIYWYYWMKETSFQLNNARIYVNCICVQDKKDKFSRVQFSQRTRTVTSSPGYECPRLRLLWLAFTFILPNILYHFKIEWLKKKNLIHDVIQSYPDHSHNLTLFKKPIHIVNESTITTCIFLQKKVYKMTIIIWWVMTCCITLAIIPMSWYFYKLI